MAVNLLDKLNTGITPEQFIDGMTKNKEQFLQWSEQFAWANDEDRLFFEGLKNKSDLNVLILMADWCGDVVRNVPVVFKALAELPVRVLIMEENLEVMDQFLTFGGRSIPVVLFTNNAGDVIAQWGPRPTYIQEPMAAFKKANPDREAADYQDNLAVTRQEIMRRYGENAAYQQLVVHELRAILEKV